MSGSDSQPAASVTASAAPPEGEDTSGAGSAAQGTAERLWSVIDSAVSGVCVSWRPSFAHRAAEAVLAAGYRQVIDNDETVERVARAMLGGPTYLSGQVSDWDVVTEGTRESFRRQARAALQALRGDRDG